MKTGQASKADERTLTGVSETKLRSTSTIARLHTAAARLATISPCKEKIVSTGIPVPAVENTNAGCRRKGILRDSSPLASGHILRRASGGVGIGTEDGGDSSPSSQCSNADAGEQIRTSHGNSDAAALRVSRLLSKSGSCDSRDGTSKGGSSDSIHSCSGEESVDLNDEMMREVSGQASTTDWSSSDSDSDGWLFAEKSAEPPQPAELCAETKKGEARDDEPLPHVTAANDRDKTLPQTLPRREAPKRHSGRRGTRQKRRGARRRSEAKKAGAADSASRDESWSNRALTVLFKELGLHQSCQRAVLSKHMPATFKGDEGGELQPEPPSPLPRIDRPHFRPTFVELTAAGKGSTVRFFDLDSFLRRHI